MTESENSGKKPLVGFFTSFQNLAETGRAILIAKRYVELGGKVIFFSHSGRYESLAKDFGYTVVIIKPQYTEKSIDRLERILRGDLKGIPYVEKFLQDAVKNEILIFKETGVKMVVSFGNPQCSISARAAQIPLVVVTPWIGSFQVSIPDSFENFFTFAIPKKIKIAIVNWCLHGAKNNCKQFNKVAKKFNVKPFKTTWDLSSGDETLVTDFLEFVKIFHSQKKFSNKNYIGIVVLEKLFKNIFSKEQVIKIDGEIKQHLKKPGKTILLSMGSSGEKAFFLKILNTLNKTSYNSIVVYTNILNENELPKLNNNILLKKFVPSMSQLHMMVDLAIIHGGQGTVYTAAYAGKPVIGFPMQYEQHLNLEKLVIHGTGFMLSRKYFKEETLLKTINKIFDNYDFYLKNAQSLANKIPKPEGDKNAARRIVEILDGNKAQLH